MGPNLDHGVCRPTFRYKADIPQPLEPDRQTNTTTVFFITVSLFLQLIHPAMASSEPDAESLRSKALALARKISEAWFTVVASHDKTDLQELRLLLARHNGWLSDLQEEGKAIREDKTICIQRVSCSLYQPSTLD
jgi:hypothetical protein